MFLVYTSYLQGLSVNEGQSINIQCPIGYTISILNGWYGRQDAVTFLSIAMLNTNCYLDILFFRSFPRIFKLREQLLALQESRENILLFKT